MGFKSVEDYNEERFGGFFILRNDGDYADVIFLYRNVKEFLMANVHYIKSADYSGYVHCCGRGCPACEKDIKVQTKLFIPLYNLTTGKIEFFDRSMRFEPQFQQQVFQKFANPSEYVFRITRKGASGDVNTTYDIRPTAKNSSMTYDQILADNNASFPEYYENICRDISPLELRSMLNQRNSEGDSSSDGSYLPDYQVKPRGISNPEGFTSEAPEIPDLPEFDDMLEGVDGVEGENLEENVDF